MATQAYSKLQGSKTTSSNESRNSANHKHVARQRKCSSAVVIRE